ncbi:MAG: hypothetical protein AB1726_13685 [Planctomycetota bacterium]
MTAGNLRGEEMAALFLVQLPRIVHVADHCPAPFVAAVTGAGVERYDR